YIAVKVQMDTTGHDTSGVRNWYRTAHELGDKYRIRVYPSFMFFSPDGQAVHKATGLAEVREFLVLARAATNPQEQYYTLLAQYGQGTLPYSLMPYLANMAKGLREDSLSSLIAGDYLHYLGKIPVKDLWTKDNIKFMKSFGKVIHYGDTIFQRYAHNRIKIDSIMGD